MDNLNLRTKTLFPHGGQFYTVEIFGYVSHGIPGIEVVGLGKYGRSIKEKFIFLTRVYRLKMPKRRYVLCVEGEIEGLKFKNEEFRYLELPLLITLWSLSRHLPFVSLEDCFCSGKVGIDGYFSFIDFNQKLQTNLLEILGLEEDIKLKIIAPNSIELDEEFYHLSLEELMESLRLASSDK